jgi:branched-subunit amino acid ABC-type transport system permease component
VSGSTSFLESHAAFLWQALKESANLLMKAVAFYLAIAAAILGYVLSHPVAKSLRVVAALTIMLATALFTIAVGSVAWGLWTGVRNLQRAQEMLSPGSFAGLEMASFFTRARIVFWIIIITSLLVLLILLTAIAYSLFQ